MGDMKKREFENFVGGSSHDAGDGDDNKIRKIDQVQERQFQEGRSFYPNMDPKNLKEFIERQGSSQKRSNKQKKAQNVVELEMQVEDLQTRIGFLYSQIEAYENKKLLLEHENEAIKLQLAVEEKERLSQEVEILKNMAELVKMNGLTRIQVDGLMKMMGFNSNLKMEINEQRIHSTEEAEKHG
ncbi:basic leucine zipper 34-like [Senna tora]|uniref:Basic leucine zipper 34-like n=1 Tax=Senna tora TaxID=362788 RepID=A0A834WWF7_9FABA|nr:basic leucine zipper 34-like [Senna tora]